MIHKQSFGGKIIGFQSLKWLHNGYTVWGSKGKRSNSTPFCFGCPDTFVTGVYKGSLNENEQKMDVKENGMNMNENSINMN